MATVKLPEDHGQWMCSQCFTDGVEIGILAPGYSIIHYGGQYYLLGGQGHLDDILLTFKIDPWPDPDPNSVWNLSPEGKKKADQWVEELSSLNCWRLPPGVAYYLIKECVEYAGWIGTPRFHQWLFNHVGSMVKKHKRKLVNDK